MKLYHFLCQLPFLKHYAFKFLFVAFVGIHIPLMGLVIWVASDNAFSIEKVLWTTLVLTLLATSITLYFLNSLISPLLLVNKTLQVYSQSREIIPLPQTYQDEIGYLMKTTQNSLTKTENLLQEKNDLMYLLSHDLKNQIIVPAQLADLILSEKPAEPIATFTKQIMLATNRQTEFLHQLINFLRYEDGLVSAANHKETVSLSSLYQEVETQLQTKLMVKQVSVACVCKPENLAVHVKKDLFKEVLVNLVDNAIKFSYPGSAISINGHMLDDQVVIKITDPGIGFEKENAEKLFDKFTTMGRPGTANESTTGIGLYLSRKIIEQHQGTLTAQSEGKDKGATFTIFLPSIF
ncbi:MAG: HAMP domain-containing histidine kinase [Verrucomicrobia bacterium]|nr:HAMP domain-containing histidine kinase [Cytophagales bacterium]